MDRVQIRIRERVDPQWSDWFHGMQITIQNDDEPPLTVMEGLVQDQATLRGILNSLWDLNLSILSVNLLEDDKL